MPAPGYRDNERPLGFELDGVYHRIYAIENQWYSLKGQNFKVRAHGKTYILRYDEEQDEWTLQGGFDGDELLAIPNLEVVTVGPESIREAEQRIAGCE